MTITRVERSETDDGQVQLKVVEETPLQAPLPTWGQDADLRIVGKDVPRVEGDLKVTGRAEYAYDVRLPGQLYAKVLRSPHPHARIKRIDTSRAEQLTGVRAVVCRANTPEIGWFKDTVLFEEIVRYVGDEIAAVAADSEEIAEDALRLIQVDYEPLPFVTDAEAALRPEAPEIHPAPEGTEQPNLTSEPIRYARGNVEAGFREADVTIEHVYTTQTALHNCLEPHGCVATWEADELTLWDSTQSIFDVRQEVATRLKMPEHKVRVIKQFMGGGFGSKQIAWKHTAIAALLSKRAGRPVQLMLDREAENLASGNRNPTRQCIRLGAKRDGTMTAIEAEILQGVGAYQVGGEAADVDGPYQTLYRCRNVRTVQTAAYTNTGPAVAFRAPGYVEGAFALESAMDELARELGMDPLELRLRNYSEVDQQGNKPYSSPEGLRRCYEEATKAFGWQAAWQLRAQGQTDTGIGQTRRRGIGFAAHDWIGGSGHPPGYAWIKLNGDGSADVVTGTQDIGTGSRTGLAQVAAEELGLPLDRIALRLGDTAYGPYAPVSSGSATQSTIGPAVRAAAADAKRQLLEVAAALLEVAAHDLDVREGEVVVRGQPARKLDVGEVMAKIEPRMIQGFGSRDANPPDKTIHTFGAQCVEVEVDVETGEVIILRVVAAHDCGRLINPMLVDSQVIGAVTQGIGYALTEERIVDERRGTVMNANLEEYHVPTVMDIPEIVNARVDLPDPIANPTGAKGIGEPPLVPTAPAIANAVFDAVGVRIRAIPINRRRLLTALQKQSAGGSADAATGNDALHDVLPGATPTATADDQTTTAGHESAPRQRGTRS